MVAVTSVPVATVTSTSRLNGPPPPPFGRPSFFDDYFGGVVEKAIREHLSAGHGILRVAALVGVGSGTVQRVKTEMAGQLAEAA
jgi:hypothetical protein